MSYVSFVFMFHNPGFCEQSHKINPRKSDVERPPMNTWRKADFNVRKQRKSKLHNRPNLRTAGGGIVVDDAERRKKELAAKH